MQKTHEIKFSVPISVVDRCSQISVLPHRWLSHGLGFKKMWADSFVRESWVNFVLPCCFLMRSRVRVFSEREPRERERERERDEERETEEREKIYFLFKLFILCDFLFNLFINNLSPSILLFYSILFGFPYFDF